MPGLSCSTTEQATLWRAWAFHESWDKNSRFPSACFPEALVRPGLLTLSPVQTEVCSLSSLGAAMVFFHQVLLLLQGAHVTINARAEEDVEPECIMQKVARASGANYTFHKESSRFQDTGPQAPVVSAMWA